MPFPKLSNLFGSLLHLPKSSKAQQKTSTPRTKDSSSRSPPSSPSLDLNSSSDPSSSKPISYCVPVEVIERILLFVFLPSTNPTESNTFPSPPPHPLQLLLASKGFYHLVLPHFYQSIRVLESQDWVTLFNQEDGILGARELGMGRASFDDRRSWVKEFFIRGQENCLLWIPWDLKGAKKKRLGRKAFEDMDPSFLQLQTLGPPLPNLLSVFVLPYFDSSPSPEVLEIFKFLRMDRIFGMRVLVGGEYRDNLVDYVGMGGHSIQGDLLRTLKLDRSSSFLYHPLALRPQHICWLPGILKDSTTWVVDCKGMDATSLGEALEGAVRWLSDPWDPSPFIIPWNDPLVVWTGVKGAEMRACARRWAELGWVNEEYKLGWKFVMKDGSTRPFFDEELEEDRELW